MYRSWSCFIQFGTWNSHLRDLRAESYTLPNCRKCWNGYIPWLFSCWTHWQLVAVSKKNSDLRHFVTDMSCRETISGREKLDTSWTSGMIIRSAFTILFSIWFPAEAFASACLLYFSKTNLCTFPSWAGWKLSYWKIDSVWGKECFFYLFPYFW